MIFFSDFHCLPDQRSYDNYSEQSTQLAVEAWPAAWCEKLISNAKNFPAIIEQLQVINELYDAYLEKQGSPAATITNYIRLSGAIVELRKIIRREQADFIEKSLFEFIKLVNQANRLKSALHKIDNKDANQLAVIRKEKELKHLIEETILKKIQALQDELCDVLYACSGKKLSKPSANQIIDHTFAMIAETISLLENYTQNIKALHNDKEISDLLTKGEIFLKNIAQLKTDIAVRETIAHQPVNNESSTRFFAQQGTTSLSPLGIYAITRDVIKNTEVQLKNYFDLYELDKTVEFAKMISALELIDREISASVNSAAIASIISDIEAITSMVDDVAALYTARDNFNGAEQLSKEKERLEAILISLQPVVSEKDTDKSADIISAVPAEKKADSRFAALGQRINAIKYSGSNTARIEGLAALKNFHESLAS